MAKNKEPSLIEMLAKASADDLAELDEQIATKQAELDKATATIAADLASLKILRKVLDVKVNGKPPRQYKRKGKGDKAAAAPSSTGKSDAANPMLKQIVDVLKTNGACKTMTIAKKLGGEHLEHTVRMLVGQNKDRFIRNEDGTWELIA